MIAIVEEDPSQRQQIADLLRAAFDGDAEAALVDRLRRDRLVAASLVAHADGDVVGHILFSDLAVTVDGRAVTAAALAPLAVHRDHQRQGIGSRLVLAGLSIVRERGYAAVIVVGHADYYPRFGFSAALARKLTAPFTGDSFMALELVPGSLRGETGTVRYPPAFELD
ncbi:MAG TPA: N-acetyltransferase [Vineibacter sp.]|nr:N-acetyltransferase [Vineibacter sp.]